MNRIEEMIRELCPNGVEYKALGEIGTFVRGNGLQKKDFMDEGVGCIHYGQIYTYYNLFASQTKSYVDPILARKLTKVKTGDIIIACTSENIEDVCKAIAWLGEDEIVTGGHACVFSHEQNPKYISYFFNTDNFFQQKKKYARGAKVVDIKVGDIAKIEIPVPPLAIQNEIVNILDKFTELEAELEARRKQYEYYRNKLLNFSKFGGGYSEDVKWCKLSDIGTFYGGLTGKSKRDFIAGNAKFITYMNVYSNIAIDVNMNDMVQIAEGEKQNKVEYGDVVFTGSSETPDDCGMSSVMTTRPDGDLYLNSFCFGFRMNDRALLLPDFMKFLFRSEEIRKQIIKTASGVTRFNVSKKRFGEVVIPIPPMKEQQRIVAILDKFETLVNDISEGLPAEIAARRQQYEYYRDKLLTFKRKEDAKIQPGC